LSSFVNHDSRGETFHPPAFCSRWRNWRNWKIDLMIWRYHSIENACTSQDGMQKIVDKLCPVIIGPFWTTRRSTREPVQSYEAIKFHEFDSHPSNLAQRCSPLWTTMITEWFAFETKHHMIPCNNKIKTPLSMEVIIFVICSSDVEMPNALTSNHALNYPSPRGRNHLWALSPSPITSIIYVWMG
jgi:hypothetical protein